jgi:hypothetical protein
MNIYDGRTRRQELKLRLARQVAEILKECVDEQIRNLDTEIELIQLEKNVEGK